MLSSALCSTALSSNIQTQVYLPRLLIQLPLRAPLSSHQSRRQPDPLHPHLQQLLLWYAVSPFRRWHTPGLGKDQANSAGELCE